VNHGVWIKNLEELFILEMGEITSGHFVLKEKYQFMVQVDICFSLMIYLMMEKVLVLEEKEQ
jgi:hypothetical protein